METICGLLALPLVMLMVGARLELTEATGLGLWETKGFDLSTKTGGGLWIMSIGSGLSSTTTGTAMVTGVSLLSMAECCLASCAIVGPRG